MAKQEPILVHTWSRTIKEMSGLITLQTGLAGEEEHAVVFAGIVALVEKYSDLTGESVEKTLNSLTENLCATVPQPEYNQPILLEEQAQSDDKTPFGLPKSTLVARACGQGDFDGWLYEMHRETMHGITPKFYSLFGKFDGEGDDGPPTQDVMRLFRGRTYAEAMEMLDHRSNG